MKQYKIIVQSRARKFIKKQTPAQQHRLLLAISKLPYEGDIKPLRGHVNEFRLRVGDYRVIYSKFDDVLIIDVLSAGNRGDIYKSIT